MIKALSLGAGLQSSTIAMMAAEGEIEAPDCAIFADTHAEPRAVMEWLEKLEKLLPFPVYRVSAGDIRANVIGAADHDEKRFVAVPFYTNGGIGRRQCTKEFKLQPISKKLRELLGYKPRQRIPALSAQVWIGITTDELIRATPARDAWQVNRWPLLDKRMSRGDCELWWKRRGQAVPPKSSCVLCPFRRNASWRDMRDNAPDEFQDAIAVDVALRANGAMKGMRKPQFMHDSRKPLGEADIDSLEDKGQGNLLECLGHCAT